jgi:hypothetical protein
MADPAVQAIGSLFDGGKSSAFNNGGMLMAKAFRRSHSEFKRRHIKPILQLKPLNVPCGEILEIRRNS